MFKEASKQKLRFQTNRGLLSTENLWDLSLSELDALAVSYEEQYKESGKKSFLAKKFAKDKTTKLRFDIVLDVLTTKMQEQEELENAKAIKENNEEILTLIVEKQKDELKGKSVAELEKMLK